MKWKYIPIALSLLPAAIGCNGSQKSDSETDSKRYVSVGIRYDTLLNSKSAINSNGAVAFKVGPDPSMHTVNDTVYIDAGFDGTLDLVEVYVNGNKGEPVKNVITNPDEYLSGEFVRIRKLTSARPVIFLGGAISDFGYAVEYE